MRDFWQHVDKGDGKGCWRWTGYKTPTGYGRLWRGLGKSTLAHRAAWELTTGEEPPRGALLCHTCDVRDCVNPAHLYVGDVHTNAADMVRRGRAAVGIRNGRYTRPGATSRGEHRPAAKLTWQAVREIRAKAGEVAQKELARLYGVSRATVWHIVHNKAWVEATGG